jgi:hypothetical protein
MAFGIVRDARTIVDTEAAGGGEDWGADLF